MPSDAQSTRGVTVLLRPSCGCFGRIGDQRVTARTVAAVVIAALAVFILGNAAQTQFHSCAARAQLGDPQ